MSYRRYLMIVDTKKYAVTRTKNPQVMDVVYAQGWAANPNYMTFEEAAAVTDIGTVFRGLREVYFDEFQYFTSVTSIPDNAFYRNYSSGACLKSIVLPNSITSIGKLAFRYCYFTTELVIPPSVTQVKDIALSDVSGGFTLVIDNNNVMSSANDWISNAQISKYKIGEHCTTLSVYDDCLYSNNFKTLIKVPLLKESYTIHSECTKLRDFACEHCRISDMSLTNSITELGKNAFYNSQITSIDLKNVTKLGNGAFTNCKSVSGHVDLSNITSLGSLCFRYCTFYSMDFGSNISGIDQTFQNCGQFKIIIIRRNTPPTVHSGCTSQINTNNATVYVPDAAVNDYKADSNWSAVANHIMPLSEYQPN